MLESLLLTAVFGLVAFAFGYLTAHAFYDGRKENVTKDLRLLTGIKFADIIVTLSIVAQILIYVQRNF